MTRFTLRFDVRHDIWTTSNMRLHWAEKAKRTAEIRQSAHGVALDALRRNELENQTPLWTPDQPCHVKATIAMPTRRRFDPANASPTLKAIIDGLTDAGLWNDDDWTTLKAVTYTHADTLSPKGFHRVALTIEDWKDPE